MPNWGEVMFSRLWIKITFGKGLLLLWIVNYITENFVLMMLGWNEKNEKYIFLIFANFLKKIQVEWNEMVDNKDTIFFKMSIYYLHFY